MAQKKLVLSVMFLMLFFSLFSNRYTVNNSKSSIVWIGKKVVGEHSGTIKFRSGEVSIKDGKIESGSFIMDMNSLICTDLTDPDWNTKLVNHLKSDDFFGVKKFPTAKLVVESDRIESGKHIVMAQLTIKGQTHQLKFDFKKEGDFYIANVKIDRTLYNIRYGSGKFFDNLGDKLIDDFFELKISIFADEK